MTLTDLVHGTDVTLPEELKNLEINGITYNSTKIKQGDAFICINGFKTDGHIFAKEAAHRGASIVISEKALDLGDTPVLITEDSRRVLSKIAANFYGRDNKPFQVIGITGTNGKTTTSYMIKSILEAGGIKCGLLGTISYQFSNIEYESVNTTPESSDLQRLFAEMRMEAIENCVIEVSSHALSMGRVDDISFNDTIFTNLTPDHMDFHESTEDYYQAKRKLFFLNQSVCLINLDDPYGKRIYDELKESGRKVLGYSLMDKSADYSGKVMDATEMGTTILITEKAKELGLLKLRTPGIFTVYNGMAALAATRVRGLPFATIKAGLENLKGVPGRFQLAENSKDIPVIVDYAHTPDALEKVLKTANDFKKGRLICVFGCGGDRDKTKRVLMGAVAGRYSDYCIITSDNPRTEKQQDISADIEKGIRKTDCQYTIIDDRYDAIKKAVSMYTKGDLIMIAGKGHETYQMIGTEKKHFDDREVVINIIENDE